MKKLFFWIALLSAAAWAQTTTPNYGFNVPTFNTPNWNYLINSNFFQLDTLLHGIQINETPIGTYTVATLPAGVNLNTIAGVTDANGLSCTVGGGSTNMLCRWNGSSWVPFGITGFVDFSSNQTIGGNKTFTASTTVVSSNNTQYATSATVGTNAGAKVNTAISALGGVPGLVVLDASAGLDLSGAVIPANVALEIAQPGTYITSSTIPVGQTAGIFCLPPAAMGIASAQPPCVIQEASGSNLPSVVSLNGYGGFLENLTIDGNKTANPSGGVGVLINIAGRMDMNRVTVQNANSHGISMTAPSLGSGSKLSKVMSISNGGDGIFCNNSVDVWLTDSEVENNIGHGIELNNCAAWRIETSDIGGNHGNGIYVYGSVGGAITSSFQIIEGNEFGNNFQNDIYIVGYNAGDTSILNNITGNSFAPSACKSSNGTCSGAANGVYNNITLVDGGQSTITGNVFASSGAPNQDGYAISLSETAVGRAYQSSILGNAFSNTSLHGFYVDSNQNKSALAANSEGLGFSQIGAKPYVVNNVPLSWMDLGGSIRQVLLMGADNNTYLYGHPTLKQVIVQPNPGVITNETVFQNGSTAGPNIPIVTAFTAGAGSSDNVTVTGMTSSGHCSAPSPTNATAAAMTGVYISAKTTNQITVNHSTGAGATFDILCTPN